MRDFVIGYFGRREPDHDTGMRKAAKIAFKLGQHQPLYRITKEDVRKGLLIEHGDYHQLRSCVYKKDSDPRYDRGTRVGDYVRGEKKTVKVWGKKDAIAIVRGKTIAGSVHIKEYDGTSEHYAETEYKWWVKEHYRITVEKRNEKAERERQRRIEERWNQRLKEVKENQIKAESEMRIKAQELRQAKKWFEAQLFTGGLLEGKTKRN